MFPISFSLTLRYRNTDSRKSSQCFVSSLTKSYLLVKFNSLNGKKRLTLDNQYSVHKNVMGSLLLETWEKMIMIGLKLTDIIY